MFEIAPGIKVSGIDSYTNGLDIICKDIVGVLFLFLAFCFGLLKPL